MLTRSIVLIGLTGSGKTTVGKRLSKQLDCPFVDTDDVVSESTGLAVREIFQRNGEPAFRALETSALEGILADATPKVIAAAGGTILAEQNRRSIQNSNSDVIWLDAEPKNLLKRISIGSHRPLLDDNPVATLMEMSAERRGLYAELADLRVDANGRDINRIVKIVFDFVTERGVS
ncbi:MAG: shikimate kinase [Ilumatobacteraceae bacterium]